MPQCTDNLDNESFVDYLRSRLSVFDGKVYSWGHNKFLGSLDKNTGYIRCGFEGRVYQAHRLIYAITNGPLSGHIDHIDRNKTNNRPENLRLCNQGLNVANANLRSDNTSGYIGVIWHKASNRWQAQTMFNGKRVHVGLYLDKEQAAMAYNIKLRELFGYRCTFNKVFHDVEPEMCCD